MGSVNFNTEVNKTVDITKNVFLDVNKDVFSFVDIEGNLATAEASADAVGGGGDPAAQASGSRCRLNIDDYTDTQLATAKRGRGNPNPDIDGPTRLSPTRKFPGPRENLYTEILSVAPQFPKGIDRSSGQ